MSEDSVVRLQQPGTIEGPLTDILRDGARRLLQQAIEAEVEPCLPNMPTWSWKTAGVGWSGIAAPPTRLHASASPRRSCRCLPGARGRWMRCCRCCNR